MTVFCVSCTGGQAPAMQCRVTQLLLCTVHGFSYLDVTLPALGWKRYNMYLFMTCLIL